MRIYRPVSFSQKLSTTATFKKQPQHYQSVLLLWGLLLSQDPLTKSDVARAATPTTEACFDFDSATKTIIQYYANENNDTAQPACPSDVVIPSAIGSMPVEVIGGTAFSSGSSAPNITSVVIPDSVTEIMGSAFSDNQLESVILSKNLTSIGSYAFLATA